jgi:hypothetical protein
VYTPAAMVLPTARGVAARVYDLIGRRPLARALDVLVLAFVVGLHRVIGAKFLYAQLGFDEHYFVWEGFSMAKGMVPYRDFQEFKPPMIFVVNALAIKFFGLASMAYRHMFMRLSLVAFLSLTIALLSRGVSRWLVAGLAALMINHFFDGGLHDSTINNAESLGLDFFMIGCGILLVKTRWKRTQLSTGAVLLALAPLSKEPFALATVAAWLCLLFLDRFESKDERTTRRFFIWTIGSVASVLAVWLVYMLATRSLGWYVFQLKLNIAYTKNYALQLGWFPKDPAEGVAAESWRRLRETYANWGRLGVFLPLFVAGLLLWPGRQKLVGLAALACMAGGLYAVTVGHGFAPHYFIMAMTGTFFFAVVGAIALDAYTKRAGAPLRRWAGLSVAAVAVVAVWPRYSDEREKYAAYKPLDPPVSQAHVAMVQKHSSPGDRIWTLGEPLLYVYSDRLSAVREPAVIDEFIPYYPGNTDEERVQSEREELTKNRPKLIVFGDDPVPGYGRKQKYIRLLAMPFIKDYGYKQIDEKVYERP